MKRTLVCLTVALFGAVCLSAESLVTLDMKLLQAVGRFHGEDAWYHSGAGTVDLSLKSTGNRDVKGELSLIYTPLEAVAAYGAPAVNVSRWSLDKASIKVQFPSLRLTMGKTRIGWGEGYVFNSGDVLYGSLSPTVDLTADETRSDTAWLTLVRWSPGRTYLEAVIMAPALDMTDPSAPRGGALWDTSAGLRLVTRVLDLDVELGYLAKGEIKTPGDREGHRPYLTFHGYGAVDYYGAASMALPFEGADWEGNVKETANISFGAFRQFGLGYNGTLSVRLEALVYPWQEWEETTLGANQSYGVYLYPELVFTIGQGISLPVMAVVSPVEQSAQLTAGFNAKVYQGFSFLTYLNAGLGEDSDSFPSGDLSLMAGMRFQF